MEALILLSNKRSCSKCLATSSFLIAQPHLGYEPGQVHLNGPKITKAKVLEWSSQNPELDQIEIFGHDLNHSVHAHENLSVWLNYGNSLSKNGPKFIQRVIASYHKCLIMTHMRVSIQTF